MRWLHLSDIHIDSDSMIGENVTFKRHFLYGANSGGPETLQNHGMSYPIKDMHVDCIIFTGDLFNRGKWVDGQVTAAIAFLKEIYRICSEAGKWGWKDTEPMNRLYYCPGNHDVLREAYYIDEGIVTHRRSELSSAAKYGCFCATDEKYTLLTQGSFGVYESTMQKIVSTDGYESVRPYEYKKFVLPSNIDAKEIAIVGINTALLAGQAYDSSQIDEQLQKAHTEFLEADACYDTSKALEAYGKYHVASQKKMGHLMNDEGNLCFISNDAKVAVTNQLSGCLIPILFGHHPLTFFSNEARSQIDDFVDENAIAVYLCGHTHKASGRTIVNNDASDYWDQKNGVHQISVGGIFLDKTQYNQASFSIGQIELNRDTGGAKLDVSVYTLSRDVFGKERWDCHNGTQDIKIHGMIPPPSLQDTEASREDRTADNSKIEEAKQSKDTDNVENGNENELRKTFEEKIRELLFMGG